MVYDGERELAHPVSPQQPIRPTGERISDERPLRFEISSSVYVFDAEIGLVDLQVATGAEEGGQTGGVENGKSN